MFGIRYGTGNPEVNLGAPLMLQTGIGENPRATVAAMYASIIADLNEAIQLFTDYPITRTGETAKSHLSLPVAHGLRARVALAQQDWATAITHAQAAINSVPAGVRLANADELRDGFFTVANPDWIWGSRHTAEQTIFFFGWGAYATLNFSSGQIRTNPRGINSVLYLGMAPNDIRRDWWSNDVQAVNQVNYPSLHAAGFLLPRFGVRKFRINGTNEIALNSAIDLPHMRLSEMYLILAEANARAGYNAPAQAALTRLMEIRVPNFTTSNTGQALIDEIMINRRIELWGEGHRWLDLKRTNSPLVRTTEQGHRPAVANISILGRMTMSAPDGQDADWWQFVFPRREITANPAIVQNP
jgi:hypothetical protein